MNHETFGLGVEQILHGVVKLYGFILADLDLTDRLGHELIHSDLPREVTLIIVDLDA